jgi:hypothetical protein
VQIALSGAVSSDAPQLPEIVIVWPTTVARLLKISTNSACPRCMFAYEIVRDVPVICDLDRETQPRQKLMKLVPDEVFNAGKDFNDEQPRQKLMKLVPDEVFSAGKEDNDKQ